MASSHMAWTAMSSSSGTVSHWIDILTLPCLLGSTPDLIALMSAFSFFFSREAAVSFLMNIFLAPKSTPLMPPLDLTSFSSSSSSSSPSIVKSLPCCMARSIALSLSCLLSSSACAATRSGWSRRHHRDCGMPSSLSFRMSTSALPTGVSFVPIGVLRTSCTSTVRKAGSSFWRIENHRVSSYPGLLLSLCVLVRAACPVEGSRMTDTHESIISLWGSGLRLVLMVLGLSP
mmetsp:Transcript_21748/g.54924  ORF Transcript_21748/g.54924 Transcript_21748/m.54924 type:complete len:231 (-) Transcript_21748:1724-2416(-)